MNLLPVDQVANIQRLLCGMSIRAVERHTGIHRDTIMRIKHERVTKVQRQDGKCYAASQPKRLEVYGQPIPEGMRLGWTCAVPYCDNPDHFVLAKNLNHGKRDYKAIRARLCALADDEYFDLPDEADDEKSLVKFRAGLGARGPHFLLRSLPTGGVRIIRTGTWYDDKVETLRKYPNLIAVAKPKNSIGSVWLGQFWGCWDDLASERITKCSERGCVFPVLDGATVCRQHWLWDSALVSYPREQKLDKRDAFARAGDDRSIGSGALDSLFHSGWLGEDKYGFLHTTTMSTTGNNFVRRSARERDNDKWWKENVVDQGIEAPGVMIRKTSKELKAEMELLIDQSLQRYTEEQSAAAIRAFWRVTKEENPIRPIYADELLKQEPDLRPGVNVQDSLRGKMRRGGGHGQGIRKKQRKRAPGWTSSRHNHDPQYFTRETVRGMDYDELEEDYPEVPWKEL